METKRNVISVILAAAILLLTAVPAQSVTEDEIEASIQAGIEWLVDQQDPGTGKWQDVPRTGFVLIKLQDRAYELGYESPFDPAYPYSSNVIAGWQYLLTASVHPGQVGAYAPRIGLTDPQPHGNADTNLNGYGVSFQNSGYNTGICLMALAATGAPNRANDGGLDYDGDGNADTYGQIAREDAVDWLAFAQVDAGSQEGAMGRYGPNGGGDNSVSGYAVLGLAAAEGFGCTVPQWVKDELDIWIDYIQNDQGPGDDGGEPTPDGGSGYYVPSNWVNELKTGNLIFEMTFYGDDSSVTRFQDAIDYIERHWQDTNLQPGWGYNQAAPAQYQAMYCLMKGLEYSVIDLIDLDGDNTPEHDWYNEFATVLLVSKTEMVLGPVPRVMSGQSGSWGTMSGKLLSTVWALFTLEKITPPPPEISVFVDIKPQSCPNPLNKSSKGVLPVAILGTADLDVTTIDPATVVLSREGVEAEVGVLRWDYEDVATPFEGELCDCHELGADGYLDLTLKFDMQELVSKLELCDVPDGQTIPLTLTGNLAEEFGGTAIRGADCVRIQDKKGPQK